MLLARSVLPSSGASVWLLVGLGVFVAAAVLVYWFRSARDTLDQMEYVLPPRADGEEGRVHDENRRDSA